MMLWTFELCIVVGWVAIIGIVGGNPVSVSGNTKIIHPNIWKAMKYVYYPKDDNWHSPALVGVQGPCPENMVFLRYKHRPYRGTCACNPKADVPLVYKAGKCHPIFTQGPCNENEWIVQVNRKVDCAPNPCSNIYVEVTENGNGERPLVDFGNDCVEYKSACDGNFQVIAQLDSNGTYTVNCSPEPQYSNANPEYCYSHQILTIHGECISAWEDL